MGYWNDVAAEIERVLGDELNPPDAYGNVLQSRQPSARLMPADGGLRASYFSPDAEGSHDESSSWPWTLHWPSASMPVRFRPRPPKRTKRDDDNNCFGIFNAEMAGCYSRYGRFQNLPGHQWKFRGCKERAEDRRGLCIKNKGRMPPNAPDPWDDRDILGRPTIHE